MPPRPWWDRAFFPAEALIFIIAVLWCVGIPFRGFEGSWSGPACAGAIVGFIASFVLLHTGLVWLRKRLLGIELPKDDDVQKILRKSPGVAFVLVVLWAPLTEEFAFRYGMLGYFSEDYFLFALLASSLFFGLSHRRAKLLKVLMGLAFCGLYVGSGTVWVPVMAHMGLNLIGLCVIKAKLDREILEEEEALERLRQLWEKHDQK